MYISERLVIRYLGYLPDEQHCLLDVIQNFRLRLGLCSSLTYVINDVLNKLLSHEKKMKKRLSREFQNW